MCFALSSAAEHKRKEADYQKEWCTQYQGQIEVVLSDKTRCDCIASIEGKTYAIEFDFAEKWAEAIGQALYYAVQTEKTPGIVLILEKESDYKYLIRLNTTLQYHHLEYVKTWTIENYDKSSINPTPTPSAHTSRYSCTPKKTCSQMSSCEEAYFHLRECGNKSLDRDKDGIPCESICQ